MKRHNDFSMLEQRYGIHVPLAMDYLPENLRHDYDLAMDAQPILVSASNAGIPAFLTTFIDPETIKILVSPMKAATIIGEQKKGTWVDQTAMFPVLESTGEVSSYGDYSENGSSGANVNYVNRQSYLFQTVTQWGQLELERAGAGRIDYAASLNAASALTLAKFQNKSYFFGISGLQNYGLLNDPKLTTPIAPNPTGTASGTLWSTKDGAAVYGDIVSLYGQLITQTQGLVDMDSPMVLAMSPTSAVNLTKTNQYNVNVIDQLKKNFPNLEIETAVEYGTTGGQLVQMIVKSVEGQNTAAAAFNEKMRAHAVIQKGSAFTQKKTSGTWGAIIKNPYAIGQLLGV